MQWLPILNFCLVFWKSFQQDLDKVSSGQFKNDYKAFLLHRRSSKKKKKKSYKHLCMKVMELRDIHQILS